VQVHGGMGFIEETGAAQHYRDSRILPIYEGTTAIQANDLVFRKTIRDNGEGIKSLIKEIQQEIDEKLNSNSFQKAHTKMKEAIDTSLKTIDHLIASSNDQRKSAVSGVNYLMMLGYLFGGWMMSKSIIEASKLLEAEGADRDFLESKIISGNIYISNLLPQVQNLSKVITEGGDDILSMKVDWL